MKRNKRHLLPLALLLSLLTAGCGQTMAAIPEIRARIVTVTPTARIVQLEEGFSAVRFDGDDGLDAFLAQGGASSDAEVVSFLADHMLSGVTLGDILGAVFGCSTLAAESPDGARLFGRNFDWDSCNALVLANYPENGYASLSTVNIDFITQNLSGAAAMALRLDFAKTAAALYVPLDGMNEAGLAISVNMISDGTTVSQDTEKPDLTTTTAIRLLLDRAATVEEAIDLLSAYDLHASMGMMIHFAIADATGRSVAVEYIDNEMVVTETPILTNFYVTEGEKYGIGSAQSHERYERLAAQLAEDRYFDAERMRDALDSVSKHNFEEFESTEWSIVFNQTDGEAHYYHRENYNIRYVFQLERRTA